MAEIKYFLQNEMPLTSLGPNGVKAQNNLTFYDNKLNTGVPVVIAGKPSRTVVTPEKLAAIAAFGFKKKLSKNLVSLWADDGKGDPVRLAPQDVDTVINSAAA